MTKVIRLKDETFEELTKYGKWSDTMDTIVSTLLTNYKLLIQKTKK